MLKDILGLSSEDIKKYNLHLASRVGSTKPLDVFATNPEEWKEWNEFRNGDEVWTRDHVFTLIQDYHKQNRYVFGGVYRIAERLEDWKKTNIGYRMELDEKFVPFVGRLVVEFSRYQGLHRRNYRLEKFIDRMSVAEITEIPYSSEPFPGYDNINISFSSFELILSHQQDDWHTALENVKGIYLITDDSNGKKYVGSAYGDSGIWSRWADYVCTGTGGNDELEKLIKKNGLDHARMHFRFSLIECYSMKTNSEFIISRENFWKEVLLTRGDFGYNKN